MPFMEKRTISTFLALSLALQTLSPIRSGFAQDTGSPYVPNQDQIRGYLREMIEVYEADGVTPFNFASVSDGLPELVLVSKNDSVLPTGLVYRVVPVRSGTAALEDAPYALTVHTRGNGGLPMAEPVTSTTLRFDYSNFNDPSRALFDELASKMLFFKKLQKLKQSDHEVKRVEKGLRGVDVEKGILLTALVAVVMAISLAVHSRAVGAGGVLLGGALMLVAASAAAYLATCYLKVPLKNRDNQNESGLSLYARVQDTFNRRIEQAGIDEAQLPQINDAFRERLDTLVSGLSQKGESWAAGPLHASQGIIFGGLSTLIPILFAHFAFAPATRGRTVFTTFVAGILGGFVGILWAYLRATPLRNSDDIDAAVNAEFDRLLAGISRRK